MLEMLSRTNTLAYFKKIVNYDVKTFIIIGRGADLIKCFRSKFTYSFCKLDIFRSLTKKSSSSIAL